MAALGLTIPQSLLLRADSSACWPRAPVPSAGALVCCLVFRLIWKDRPSSGFLHVAELGPRIGATEFLGAPARG
jgi:hypothetical protein